MVKQTSRLKRLCAVFLSVAIAVAFVPVLGGQFSYADNEPGIAAEEAAGDVVPDAELTEEEVEAAGGVEKAAAELFGEGEVITEEEAEEIVEAEELEEADLPEIEASNIGQLKGSEEGEGEDINEEEEVPEEVQFTFDVSFNKSTGKAVVSGSITGDEFYELYLDDYYVSYIGDTEFTKTIDMKDYDVGFHIIYATLYNDDDSIIYYTKAVPTYIYGKPSNKLSYYYTGKKYFQYYANTSYSRDSSCNIYLDFKKKGGKWKKGYGPIEPYATKKKTGLKPGTEYSIRTYYGKVVEFNGEKYFFSGKDTGKVSVVKKVKTAKGKKPPVKKIKISKVKQYSRTLRVNYLMAGADTCTLRITSTGTQSSSIEFT